MKLISIFLGLVTGNVLYQSFTSQNWHEAGLCSFSNAAALICVYLASKASKP